VAGWKRLREYVKFCVMDMSEALPNALGEFLSAANDLLIEVNSIYKGDYSFTCQSESRCAALLQTCIFPKN
jgi:hypothetical protein